MYNFIKEITIKGQGRLSFYFTKTKTTKGDTYFVTTIDRDTKSQIFYMIQDNGIWRIDTARNRIEDWILNLENEFVKAIMEQ